MFLLREGTNKTSHKISIKPLTNSRFKSPMALTSSSFPLATLIFLWHLGRSLLVWNICKEFATYTVAPESIHQVLTE